jgi:firmicute plasmid replication protein
MLIFIRLTGMIRINIFRRRQKEMAEFDKSLEYISQTQTLVGQKKRELLDRETGEIIWVDQITKRTYGTKNFWKCYLIDFLSVLGIIDSKQLDIFIYIVENTQQANNTFIGTYSKIAKDVGVCRQTIASIMKKLQDNSFIKKVQNGVWLVNPNILMKGNDTKRQILLSYYQSEEPVEQISFSRTKQNEIKAEIQKHLSLDDIDTPENAK